MSKIRAARGISTHLMLHTLGVWERHIGTIRHVLNAMCFGVGGSQLTHERLVTLMVGVIISGRGMSCLQTLTSLNLAFDFWKNTSTLRKFIGYADLMDCHDLLLQHSRDNDKPKCVRKF